MNVTDALKFLLGNATQVSDCLGCEPLGCGGADGGGDTPCDGGNRTSPTASGVNDTDCTRMALEFARMAANCGGNGTLLDEANTTEDLCHRLLCPPDDTTPAPGGLNCGINITACDAVECPWWNRTDSGCGPLKAACRAALGELGCGDRGRLNPPPPPPPSYEWWYLLVVVPVVAGAVGNVLVCLAVAKDRRLHNVTNYFLTSLAIADLLVSLFVMPLGAIPGFLGHWPFGAVWCNVYVTCDVLACSSSIMHMCFVSVGRCIGIRHPLRSRLLDRRLTALKIAAAWILSGAISSSITVLGAHDTTNIMPSPYECTINNRAFFALGSLFAFYVPMVVMVASYSLTVHLLRRQKAEFAEAAAGTPPTGHRFPPACRDGRGGSLQRAEGGQGARRVRLQRSAGAKRKGDSGRSTIRRCAEDPLLSGSGGRGGKAAVVAGGGGKRGCGESPSSEEGGGSGDNGVRTPDSEGSGEGRHFRLRFHAGASTLGLNRFLSGRRRRSLAAATAVATEQKASKVLGLVFSTFVLCWAPFFLLNVAMAVSPRDAHGNQDPIFNSLAPLTLWLGYVSSTINPLIYTAFNRTFRAAFVRLLKCNCSPASAGGFGRRPPPRSPLSLLSSPDAVFTAANVASGGTTSWEESTVSSSYRTWEDSEAGGGGGRPGGGWGREPRREDWAHAASFDETEETPSRDPSVAGQSPEAGRCPSRQEPEARNGLSSVPESLGGERGSGEYQRR
ncbi:alpha-1D adrenergic receptor [Ischnura elegans]|uniref:alpha-1D adrenergic receptor n=1 Tax=Ischnura elegans TaxID=197161 RepID=UPI001ED8B372|nr:alpha-1D adrenergic receptor [Ischnura elegans]